MRKPDEYATALVEMIDEARRLDAERERLTAKWKATDYALTVEHEKSTRYGAALRRIRYARDLKRARATASEALAKPKNMTPRRTSAPEEKGDVE
jgi:hypothetical protein